MHVNKSFQVNMLEFRSVSALGRLSLLAACSGGRPRYFSRSSLENDMLSYNDAILQFPGGDGSNAWLLRWAVSAWG